MYESGADGCTNLANQDTATEHVPEQLLGAAHRDQREIRDVLLLELALRRQQPIDTNGIGAVFVVNDRLDGLALDQLQDVVHVWVQRAKAMSQRVHAT